MNLAQCLKRTLSKCDPNSLVCSGVIAEKQYYRVAEIHSKFIVTQFGIEKNVQSDQCTVRTNHASGLFRQDMSEMGVRQLFVTVTLVWCLTCTVL